MPSRAQSITICYVAWDNSASAGKTGDVANHTLRWIKDGTAAAPTNSASEVDSTNSPGVYKLTLTATECTCDTGVLVGKSSTANVVILPITFTFEQLPTAAAGSSGGLLTYGTSTGQINPSSGNVTLASAQSFNNTGQLANLPANVAQWNGTSVSISSGLPSVRATTVADKTGYSLAADQSGVTIGTVNSLGGSVAASVWDYQTSSATTAGSIGKKLAGLTETVVTSGTAQAGGTDTITLAAGASATSSLYVGELVYINGGTGVGQTRVITAYNGTSKVATVDYDWTTIPDATSTYVVEAFASAARNSNLQVSASVVVTDTSASSTNTVSSSDVNYTLTTDYDWTNGITVTGADITGWEKAVLTFKGSLADSANDNAALLAVLVTNPGDAGDGVIRLYGNAPAGSEQYYGSLSITGTSNPTVSWTIYAVALSQTLSTVYWEIAVFFPSAGGSAPKKKKRLVGGQIAFTQAVRQSNTEP